MDMMGQVRIGVGIDVVGGFVAPKKPGVRGEG
jgi:hypothetical protein